MARQSIVVDMADDDRLPAVNAVFEIAEPRFRGDESGRGPGAVLALLLFSMARPPRHSIARLSAGNVFLSTVYALGKKSLNDSDARGPVAPLYLPSYIMRSPSGCQKVTCPTSIPG